MMPLTEGGSFTFGAEVFFLSARSSWRRRSAHFRIDSSKLDCDVVDVDEDEEDKLEAEEGRDLIR
jgi:hypothetical protein